MSVSEDTNGLWFEHGQLVPRMSKLAATDIDELLGGGIGDCGTPFIVTDATQDWSCKDWTFDWLKETYGHIAVETAASFESPVRMTGRLGDYIDYITDERDPAGRVPHGFDYVAPETGDPVDHSAAVPDGPQYLVSWDLEEISSIADHFHQPYFMRSRNLLDRLMPETRRGLFNKHTFAFIGPKGSLSQLHNDHDHTHSYLSQVIGRKKLVLFSPAEAHLVAKVDRFGFTIGGSGVDPRKPDLKRFPHLMDAHPFECVLEPGDLLFLPSGWLHCAYGLTAGVSVAKDSVDHLNFGKWFQSMAVTNLPKLASRIVQHPSFQAEAVIPDWAAQSRTDPSILSFLTRHYQA